jgi:hypothetical protein
MEFKELKGNIYTWKTRRQKTITNYTKQVRAGNSVHAFIQINRHKKSREIKTKYNEECIKINKIEDV